MQSSYDYKKLLRDPKLCGLGGWEVFRELTAAFFRPDCVQTVPAVRRHTTVGSPDRTNSIITLDSHGDNGGSLERCRPALGPNGRYLLIDVRHT
jgi:hypothetical protein